MTQLIPTEAPRRIKGDGFWRKTVAMLVKEFIQLRRDRVSLAMIAMMPLMQLRSDLSRSILAALENTRYFRVTHLPRTEAEVDRLLASGSVLFAIEIPANFERAVRRGDKPAM